MTPRGWGGSTSVVFSILLRVLANLLLVVRLLAALAIQGRTRLIPCQAGVREDHCGFLTDYRWGLRLLIAGMALVMAIGMLALAKRGEKGRAPGPLD
jgi:hypothetical protein